MIIKKILAVEAVSEEDARQRIEALASELIKVIEINSHPLRPSDPAELPDFNVKFDVRMAFSRDAKSALKKALSRFPDVADITPGTDQSDR